MRRHLSKLLSGLSLVLCLLTIALWVHSFFAACWLTTIWSRGSQAVEFVSSRGRVGVHSYIITGGYPDRWLFEISSEQNVWFDGFAGDFEFAGFMWTGKAGVCVIPLWPLALVLAAFPAWRWAKRLRKPRDPMSCQSCGYDLRATPDRCPECGAIAEKIARLQ